MFRILMILVFLGAGYLAYDTYGYRYVISNVAKNASSEMSVGPVDADVTVVAYVDYDSASSRRLYPKLLNLLAADSRVRLIVRPIETDTSLSRLTTRVALAAKSQDQFMHVNNIFLTSSNDMDERYIEGIIRSSGLNYNRMKFDATSPEIEQEVKDLQSEAAFLNINTFPYIFVDHVKVPGASYNVNELKSIIGDLRSGRR